MSILKRFAWIAVAIAVVLGLKFWSKGSDGAEVREAAYQRYADLGSPEDIKRVVDRHHDACFDAAYTMGGRRTSSKFDLDKYLRLMDGKVDAAFGGGLALPAGG
jgi:hypothetical protein